jgi:hypothetical protein
MNKKSNFMFVSSLGSSVIKIEKENIMRKVRDIARISNSCVVVTGG